MRYFQELQEDDPEELRMTISVLLKLAKHREVFSMLVKNPEVAGLLAASLEYDPNGPKRIVQAMNASENQWLLNQLHLHSNDMDACLKYADLFFEYSSIINQLFKKNIFNSENYLFLRPKTENAQKVYSRWLKDFLHGALNEDDDELNKKLSFILNDAQVLRDILDTDPVFCEHFLDRYWPCFVRVADYHRDHFDWSYLLFDNPDLWEVVKRPEGEELLKRFDRETPEILNQFPKNLHQDVIQTMLAGDKQVLQAMFMFKDDPNLPRLLKRNLSPEYKNKALVNLANSPNGKQLLDRYMRYDDKLLKREVGPPYQGVLTWVPFYYTYKTFKKWASDQEPVATSELVIASIEPAIFVIEASILACTVGVGTPVVGSIEAAKETVKGGTRIAISKAMKDSAKNMALKSAGKAATKGTFNMSSAQWKTWLTTTAISEGRNHTAKHFTAGISFDITPWVRSAFQTTGIGRESFKKWTGLEARIFMRGDRKVFLYVPGFYPISRLGGEILSNAGGEIALNTPAGQEIGEQIVETVSEAYDRIKNTSWPEYASALWLQKATGTLDRRIKEISAQNNKEIHHEAI